MNKCECKNEIELLGTVVSEPVSKNQYKNVVFYEFGVAAERLSGVKDNYKVHISDHMLNECDYLTVGQKVKIYGSIQTFIEKEENEERGRQVIFVMVNSISKASEDDTDICDVDLKGFICKRRDERRTKSTDMRITDFVIACNRRGKKCDYIPSIAWNKQSKFVQEDIMIGDLIACHGRLQSRVYRKQVAEGEWGDVEVNEFCVSSCQLVRKGKRHLIADGEYVEKPVEPEEVEETSENSETSEE